MITTKRGSTTYKELRSEIEISGIPVEVVRKKIKNLHLRIVSPEGRVRVTAPFRVSDEAVRQMVVSRLTWIRRHQDRVVMVARTSPREIVTGECHYVQGQRYQLDVVERHGPPSVNLLNDTTIILQVRPQMGREQREALLHRWYRQRLQAQIPQLITRWEERMGVTVAEWGIKKMKTRWGTCNIKARRIWLSLELAKKPAVCLESVLVHEMVHLLERHHNARFKGLMDQLLPEWRKARRQLNETPSMEEDSCIMENS